MKFSIKTLSLALVAVTASFSVAAAEDTSASALSFSGTAALTSDYRYRGLTQTFNDPAVQSLQISPNGDSYVEYLQAKAHYYYEIGCYEKALKLYKSLYYVRQDIDYKYSDKIFSIFPYRTPPFKENTQTKRRHPAKCGKRRTPQRNGGVQNPAKSEWWQAKRQTRLQLP